MKLPKIYLRDLFWLTLVVALAGGWWISLRQLQMSHARHIATVRLEKEKSLKRLQRDLYQAEMDLAKFRAIPGAEEPIP